MACSALAWGQNTGAPAEGTAVPALDLRMTEELVPIGPGEESEPAVESVSPPGGARDRPLVRGLRLELSTWTRFDNNVLRTPIDPERALILEIEPRIYLDGGGSRGRLRLGYEGAYALHQNLSREDFDDHNLFADLALNLDRKFRLGFGAGLEYGHDQRGSVDGRLSPFRDPDRWREHRLGGKMIIGRKIARAEITASLDARGIRYLNNNQSDRDLEERRYWLRTHWRLSPRFAAIVQGGVTFVDYLNTSELDGRRTGLLYGIAWTATARTSGEFTIGRMSRRYSSGRETLDDSNWDVRINWAPRQYSRFTLFTNRSIQETASLLSGGNATVSQSGVRWNHAFTSRLRLDAGVEVVKADYVTGREDDITGVDATLVYQLTRWLDLAGGFEYLNRDSNLPLADYDARSVFLRLDGRWEKRLSR